MVESHGVEVAIIGAVEGAETTVVAETPVVVKVKVRGPNTRELSTLTFPLETGTGAPCISASGKMHTSVQSPPPAPGRMFSPRDLQNETGTSSALK